MENNLFDKSLLNHISLKPLILLSTPQKAFVLNTSNSNYFFNGVKIGEIEFARFDAPDEEVFLLLIIEELSRNSCCTIYLDQNKSINENLDILSYEGQEKVQVLNIVASFFATASHFETFKDDTDIVIRNDIRVTR